jgi:hypothetical protein
MVGVVLLLLVVVVLDATTEMRIVEGTYCVWYQSHGHCSSSFCFHYCSVCSLVLHNNRAVLYYTLSKNWCVLISEEATVRYTNNCPSDASWILSWVRPLWARCLDHTGGLRESAAM